MTSTTNKRSYRKLTSDDEAELVSMWGTGASTIADLALHFGMSPRGIQAALSRLDAKKGRAGMTAVRRLVAVASADTARPPAPAEIPIISSSADRQRSAIDMAYANAVQLELMTMHAVTEATALGGIAALRALDIAASALARLTTMKRAAAGLGATNPVSSGELPELVLRELTTSEVAAIRDQQLADDNAAMGTDDDVVREDGDDDRRAA